MIHDIERKQNIEWLKEQLAQQESKLAESEALVLKLRASVAHFRAVLKIVSDEELIPTELFEEEATISTESQVVADAAAEYESLNKNQPTSNGVSEDKIIEEESRGNDQIRKQTEYLGMTFAEAAQSLLDNQNPHELRRILTRNKRS